MQPLNKVLDQLEDYSQRVDEFRARCPAHNGETEDSMSVQQIEEDKVRLHSQSDCGNEAIIEALAIERSDLCSRNGKGKGKPIGPPAKEDEPAEVLTVEELPGTIDEYFGFKDEEGKLLYIQQHKGAYYRVVGEDEDG